MRIIWMLAHKEFLVILRNKLIWGIILGIPFMELVVLVHAATHEIKFIALGVIDRDQSSASRQIIRAFQASGYFRLNSYDFSHRDAFSGLQEERFDILLEIPVNFEREIYRHSSPRLALTVNAINSMKAGIAATYAHAILENVATEFATNSLNALRTPIMRRFDIVYSQWFNPSLNEKFLILSGLVVELITMTNVLFSSMSIVREKELGTIEQLNVTPLKKGQFIVGKLIPFWLIGIIQLTIGIALIRGLYHFPLEGSVMLLYGAAAIYLIAVLSFGFLISTISNNQTEAMFVMVFFMVIFILMSGFMTPVESMPMWAQRVNWLNPMAHFIHVFRLILMKGSGFTDIAPQIGALAVYALSMNAFAIWKYKKVR